MTDGKYYVLKLTLNRNNNEEINSFTWPSLSSLAKSNQMKFMRRP